MNESVIMSGFGGQGILLMGQLLCYAGMREGKNVTWMPSYGPEMRGGTANCTVMICSDRVGSPVTRHPSSLVAMNKPSLDRFEISIEPGGISYDQLFPGGAGTPAARPDRHQGSSE
ncbi:MAG: 2-oxoacid:acceptor oxidoreductase family protein [Pseudomonadota bacterium]